MLLPYTTAKQKKGCLAVPKLFTSEEGDEAYVSKFLLTNYVKTLSHTERRMNGS